MKKIVGLCSLVALVSASAFAGPSYRCTSESLDFTLRITKMHSSISVHTDDWGSSRGHRIAYRPRNNAYAGSELYELGHMVFGMDGTTQILLSRAIAGGAMKGKVQIRNYWDSYWADDTSCTMLLR